MPIVLLDNKRPSATVIYLFDRKNYSACFSSDCSSALFLLILTNKLVQIPKINAAATSVIVTSPFAPKLMAIPPTPQIKMTETTNKFLLSPRSTSLIIFKPETAMKP